MKDYWLVINMETLFVEICFPDRMMNNINACLATLQQSQQEQLLERLQQVTRNTPPFTLSYEYFRMEVHPFYILCNFYMFGDPIRFDLYTDVFREALGEYLREMRKLRDRAG